MLLLKMEVGASQAWSMVVVENWGQFIYEEFNNMTEEVHVHCQDDKEINTSLKQCLFD